MKPSTFAFGMVVLAGASVAALPVFAQTHPPGRTATGLATIAPPTPDADELAEQMRVLAKDPKDVDALIRAGELTLTLGDPTAAAVLFSRAEKIEPDNPRMKAGMAATLVRMERPGQALRLFAQAEQAGYDVEKFAADRGLAYDLVGAQERAQRDYRLALAHEKDDETLRRYALSLGISGNTAEAIEVLDPLLRKRDRAAWRDRAFIYAMNGQPEKAEDIANVMMPGPVSEGLAPFFERLDGLSPVNRAFAVHFGELNPSAARLADSKLVPSLPPLAPETKPVQVASAAKAPASTPRKAMRRKRSETKIKPGRTEIAQAEVASASSPPAKPRTTQPATVTTPKVEQRTAAPAPARLADNDAAAPVQATPERTSPLVGGEDSILERIIANITVPASEREAVPMQGIAPSAAPVPTNGTTDVAKAQLALEAAAAKAEAERLAAVKEAAERKAEREAKAEAERKAAVKRAAEEKAKAAKQAAAEKAAAAKKAAEEKKAKAEPSRFWVQVAGGANEKTLDRAFAQVVDKAPKLMKGKQGWWTPLNATNRVLTGPFKSEGEAQDFVNELAGAGLSAFPFTSKDGQKITKLK